MSNISMHMHFKIKGHPVADSHPFKPGLDIVATIAEYAFGVAPKKILRLSIHRFANIPFKI